MISSLSAAAWAAVTNYAAWYFLVDYLSYRTQNSPTVPLDNVHILTGNNVTSCFRSGANRGNMRNFRQFKPRFLDKRKANFKDFDSVGKRGSSTPFSVLQAVWKFCSLTWKIWPKWGFHSQVTLHFVRPTNWWLCCFHLSLVDLDYRK